MPRVTLCSSMLLTLTFVLGCGEQPAPNTNTPAPSAASTTPAKDDHGQTQAGAGHAAHGAGPHEGAVADWGGGKYHVEFTVDHDKQEATVYVLGSDEKSATPVKATDGKLLLNIKEPSFQVDLVAMPLEGEPEGTASRFVGKHESLGKVQEFSGTISGELEGTPYAGDFKEEPHADHPAK